MLILALAIALATAAAARPDNDRRPLHMYTTHKWGHEATKSKCRRPDCIFHPGFPIRRGAYKPYAVVARDPFEAVASGYEYHRRGAECTHSPTFKPGAGQNDWGRRENWYDSLNVTRERARAYRSTEGGLCGMLQTVPYPLGLHIFAEFAWYKWYSQADVFLRRHPKARIKCLGAGGAAARSHSSGATPAEKKRHVADVASFDARELGGRYRALRERVPCRSRYLPNQ